MPETRLLSDTEQREFLRRRAGRIRGVVLTLVLFASVFYALAVVRF